MDFGNMAKSTFKEDNRHNIELFIPFSHYEKPKVWGARTECIWVGVEKSYVYVFNADFGQYRFALADPDYKRKTIEAVHLLLASFKRKNKLKWITKPR